MSISLDNKENISISSAAHDRMTWHRTVHLSLQRNSAIVKLPSNFLHLADKTYPWNEIRWELSPVLTLSYVQNGGPVDTSSQCKASFDYCICNESFLFYYAALLTVYSFVRDGFIYSALEDSETVGHIDQSTPQLVVRNISNYAWSCSFTSGYLHELCRLLTDTLYGNERFC